MIFLTSAELQTANAESIAARRELTVAFATGKKIVRAYLENGTRSADRLVDEIAPALFETEDMRAGVTGLLEHGSRQFRGKVIFQGR